MRRMSRGQVCHILFCACATPSLVVLCRSAASEQLASDRFNCVASKLLDFGNIKKKIKLGGGEEILPYVRVSCFPRVGLFLIHLASHLQVQLFIGGKGAEGV